MTLLGFNLRRTQGGLRNQAAGRNSRDIGHGPTLGLRNQAAGGNSRDISHGPTLIYAMVQRIQGGHRSQAPGENRDTSHGPVLLCAKAERRLAGKVYRPPPGGRSKDIPSRGPVTLTYPRPRVGGRRRLPVEQGPQGRHNLSPTARTITSAFWTCQVEDPAACNRRPSAPTKIRARLKSILSRTWASGHSKLRNGHAHRSPPPWSI
mmetsp:Transcript_25572/g.33175  ORF Transcript_25572/g.33175 Transcript_25572/m.33175 type:complete len:206 (-) Transcript_25572:416-1033(-)